MRVMSYRIGESVSNYSLFKVYNIYCLKIKGLFNVESRGQTDLLFIKYILQNLFYKKDKKRK